MEEIPEEKLFTYVVVRDDLQMPAGKLASQASHASRLSLLQFIKQHPHRLDEFITNNVAGSMIVVKCKNLTQLEKAFEQAKEYGFPCAMFTDSGHVLPPHFDGSPVTTALAIGPATKESMRPITKKFQLVRSKKEELVQMMLRTEQTSGMNVFEHGISVHETYNTILEIIHAGKTAPDGWRLPEWIFHDFIVNNQMDHDIVSEYQIYHDVGKPHVMIKDEMGKTHFPNHAEKSYELWKHVGNHESAVLMKMDMDAHLLKADDIPEFSKRKQAATLLLTAVAEIHSNAKIFGGFDSDSFKIKIKNLAKRGKQIINHMEKQK